MDAFGWAADPGGRPGAHRHADEPDLGTARQHRPARGRRGCEPPLRLAAARDRGRRERARLRSAGGVRAGAARAGSRAGKERSREQARTTRSSSERAAPARRRRCCSPAAVTGCSSLDRADVPERHDLDASRPSAGRRGARALGPARSVLATGMPADRHLRVRLRAVHASPERPGRTEAPCAYAPRRTVLDKLLVDAAVRGRRRGARAIRRREPGHGRRPRRRHPGPRQGRQDRHRAGRGGHRRRRPQLARRRCRRRRGVPREAARCR